MVWLCLTIQHYPYCFTVDTSISMVHKLKLNLPMLVDYRWGDWWRQCPVVCASIMTIFIVLFSAVCMYIMVCSGPLILKLLQHLKKKPMNSKNQKTSPAPILINTDFNRLYIFFPFSRKINQWKEEWLFVERFS